MFTEFWSAHASFQYTCDLFSCSAGMCLFHLFVYGVQHLERHTGCLNQVLPFLEVTIKVASLCIVLLISWQCVVSSMGAAMCMMCNI